MGILIRARKPSTGLSAAANSVPSRDLPPLCHSLNFAWTGAEGGSCVLSTALPCTVSSVSSSRPLSRILVLVVVRLPVADRRISILCLTPYPGPSEYSVLLYQYWKGPIKAVFARSNPGGLLMAIHKDIAA